MLASLPSTSPAWMPLMTSTTGSPARRASSGVFTPCADITTSGSSRPPALLPVVFAAAPPAAQRNCHKSSQADGVGPDGELHYPQVCTASTTPAVVAAPARRAAPAPVATGPLAALRPDAPEPCRDYARDR